MPTLVQLLRAGKRELCLDGNIADAIVKAIEESTALEKLSCRHATFENAFPSCASLRVLVLESSRIEDACFESICNLSALEMLSIRKCHVKDVTSLARLQNLRELNVAGIRARGLEGAVAAMPALETLDISYINFNPSQVITAARNLTRLVLNGVHIDERTASVVGNVSQVDLSAGWITPSAARVLFASLRRTTMLQLRGTILDSFPSAALARNKTLQYLDVYPNGVSDSSFLATNKGLRTLVVGRFCTLDATLQALKALERNSTMLDFNMGYTPLPDSSALRALLKVNHTLLIFTFLHPRDADKALCESVLRHPHVVVKSMSVDIHMGDTYVRRDMYGRMFAALAHPKWRRDGDHAIAHRVFRYLT